MRIRRKLPGRTTLRRSNPPTVVGRSAAAAPPPGNLWRMRCMCGAMMEVSAEDDGRHSSCSVCQRRFAVRFSEDVGSGQKGVSLQYLTDNRKSGETSTIGGGTTSFQLPGPDPSAATHGLLMEPELPDEAHFRCPCKTLLSIPKALYEKRSKCPNCGARMLLFMLYDQASKSFTLQTFSLIDKASGSTRVLSKL